MPPGAHVARTTLLAGNHLAHSQPPFSSHTYTTHPTQLLALHVLCEMHRGPASFWAPYLTVLPQNYTTLACFPSDVAHQLQAPHAVHAATHSRTQLHQSFKRVYPVLQQLGMRACAYVLVKRGGGEWWCYVASTHPTIHPSHALHITKRLQSFNQTACKTLHTQMPNPIQNTLCRHT